METLALKVILTPTLVGTASLVGRRWGPAVSGWLVGLPLTSGPVTLFLALNQGGAFATATAAGTLAGTISQAAFCVSYGWLAERRTWPLTLAAACLAFAASTAALQHLALSALPLFVIVAATLGAALRLMPGGFAASSSTSVMEAPRWDLPARMTVATALVILLTGVAPALGPRLTGLLTPFPLYAAILAVFAHRLQGPAAAIGVLRGLLVGLFAFAAFFLLLAVLLERVGIAPAFATAILVALTVQAGSLLALRRASG